MSFESMPPERLAPRLASWVDGAGPGRLAVAIDGPPELAGPRGPAGTGVLADAIGAELAVLGRPVIRLSVQWWWRAPSLRLEHGRQDLHSLEHHWLDAAAVDREVLDPFALGEPVLTRLRDPRSGRSVRVPRAAVPDRAVLVFDGPFLAQGILRFDVVVRMSVGAAALGRMLPAEDAWWAPALLSHFDRAARADDVLVAYDHPHAPAVRWPSR